MNWNIYLETLFCDLLMLPFNWILLTTIQEKTRKFWDLFLKSTLVTIVFVTLNSFLTSQLPPVLNIVYELGILVLIYIAYYRVSGLSHTVAISIFLFAITLISYPHCVSRMIEALQNGSSDSFGIHASLLGLVLAGLIYGVFEATTINSNTRIVRNEFLTESHWLLTIPVSSIFLFMNIIMVPKNPEIASNETVLRIYISYTVFSFFLYILIFVVFRMFSLEFIETAKAREEQQFLAVTENEYHTQQTNIEQLQRFRHDFRHSMVLLQEMADRKDLKGIQDYLKVYQLAVPEAKTHFYCSNTAINAILNHYRSRADIANIESEIQVYLPSKMEIPDPTLCSILGNLYENAIEGCETLTDEPRKLSLSLTQRGNNLFILTTNNFNGIVKQFHGHYRSTKRSNGGVGTTSITTITEKYGGTAKFHHQDHMFYADIVLPVVQNQKSEDIV